MSTSKKCNSCGKTVFEGEKQIYDGKEYHGPCLAKVKRELAKDSQPFGASYEPKEGVEVVVGTKPADMPGVHSSSSHDQHHVGKVQVNPREPICSGCNKPVYYGERQPYNGKDYHGSCLMKLKEELTKSSGQPFGAQYDQKEGVPLVAGTDTTYEHSLDGSCGHASTNEVNPGCGKTVCDGKNQTWQGNSAVSEKPFCSAGTCSSTKNTSSYNKNRSTTANQIHICPECNKTVYYAEREQYDGQEYHGKCMQSLIKRLNPDGAQPFGAQY